MDVKMTSFTAIRDAEVARILEQEKERQASTINLIASETTPAGQCSKLRAAL